MIKNNPVLALLLAAVLMAAGAWGLCAAYPGFSLKSLLIGEGILLVIFLLSVVVVTRKMAARPGQFVTGVTGATFLKMLLVIGLVLMYVTVLRSYFHKPTVFVWMGMYLVFSIVEAAVLSARARQAKGA